MSRSSIFENKAFQPSVVGVNQFANNLLPTTNTFNSLFATRPLDQAEAEQIEKILTENLQEEFIEKDLKEDIDKLKQITAEIKAIGQQGTVLMGERVHRARELLKPYRDGAFTRWLESAFGTRKTGYNVLAYYEFYTALPHDDLKEKFKKLQQRTAYILASKDGDIEEKIEFISNHHDKSHDELIILIQKKFPTSVTDKRASKSSLKKLISILRLNLEKIRENKSFLQDDEKNELSELKLMFDSIL